MTFSLTTRVFRALLLLSGAALSIGTSRAEPSAEPFQIYAPSRSTNQVWIVEAKPETNGNLTLTPGKPIELDFSPSTITSHPEKPILYVTTNRGKDGVAPGAAIFLNDDRAAAEVIPFEGVNGYSYLSLDRANRFLLGCNYGDGFVDVYELDREGRVGQRISSLNEGRKNAHCVLPSPDNRSVYIPYVKDTNALFQYHFDADMGALTPMEKLNAEPPEGTGPRHLAYHPTLPILYFSNEQHLGVSVYDRAESGQLTIRQVCDLTGPEAPEEGVSSSDILITPDGKFLYAGIRGHRHEFDFISRYEVLENGEVKHLGLTPADKIPWGLALSPDGNYLVATGFGEGTLMVYRISEVGNLDRVGTLVWDKQISDVVTR